VKQAQKDGNWARGLRRLAKRRLAIRTAYPFLATVVAFPSGSWIYANHVLVYIQGKELRLLDIHHSPKDEITVDMSELIKKLGHDRDADDVKLLNYADNLVSFTYGRYEHLVVIDPLHKKVILNRPTNVQRLSVHNNSEIIVVGSAVHGEWGEDSLWVIRIYDLTNHKWLNEKDNCIRLPERDWEYVFFGLFGDHFYAGATRNRTFARLNLGLGKKRWDGYKYPGLDTLTWDTFTEDEMSGDVRMTTRGYKDGGCSLRSIHPSQTLLQLHDGGPAKQQIRVQASVIGHVSAKYSWPPATELSTELQDRILSPVGHRGNVDGIWDERTLIYETGGTPPRFGPSGPRALVVLSFDPATDFRLAGMVDQAGVRVGEAPTVSGLSPPRSPSQWRTIGRVQHFGLPSMARGGAEQSCEA
jgi:hypothetical protein